MQVTPTLNFGGSCREAIQLYEKAFGGKITCLITYREANEPAYIPLLKEEQKDFIYHAELMLGKQRIIMSDHVHQVMTFIPLMLTGKRRSCIR